MIDLKKIHKLNSKSDFEKFIKKHPIDEPVYIGNYLFHYLIIYNKFKTLKMSNHPIYKENDEGMAGVHLAAKIGEEIKNFEILDFILKNYSDYVYNVNFFSFNFINYLGVSDKVLNLIKKNKNIDWFRLFIHKATDSDSTYLSRIFLSGSFKFIEYVYDNFLKDMMNSMIKNENYEINKYQQIFTMLIENLNIKNEDLIKFYDKIDNKILNSIAFKGSSMILFAIKFRNLQVIKYLVEKKEVILDRFDQVNTSHPLIFAYQLEKESGSDKNKEITKYIWKKIKPNVDWHETDANGENIAFRILDTKVENNELNNPLTKLEFDILNSNDVWDRLNVEKYTILSQLINFDFKKYSVVLKGKNLDLEVKNGDGDNILQETEKMGNYEWNSYFKKLKKRNKNGDSKLGKCTDINLKNYKYSDHNVFQAFFYNLALGFIHLDRKYKNLYFPKYVKVNNSYPTFSTLFNGAFGRKIDEYNNFPFIIFWDNENKYHIHPSLNMLMKNAMNEKKYDFGIVFVSVDARVGLEKDKGSFHANILIYNFKTETIEYFEPYGKSGVREDIHRILKEELCWNTGFKYLEPNDYLPVSSFQYLAFENNNYYLKPGDFGGFCLAWCFWYTEHRILNPSVEPKMLVNKLINRILKGKYNLVDYIRNFANDFHINIMKLLKEIGIKKERITNLHFKSREEDKIFSFIIKNSSY